MTIKLNNPKTIRLIIAGLGIFLVVLFAEIWVVNRLSTYGDKMYQLTQTQAGLELENQTIENSIAMAASMVSLEKKASYLGFNNIDKIEYIKDPLILASAN